MFEDYLEDTFYFARRGFESEDDRDQVREFRAAVFTAASALEAFLNYVADGFEAGDGIEPYELALLQDRRFALEQGEFRVLNQTEFRRIEDKLRFLLKRFVPDFNVLTNPIWSHFASFKSLRDDITHPRDTKDLSLKRISDELPRGINAVIDLIDLLLSGIYGKRLRPRIRELRLK